MRFTSALLCGAALMLAPGTAMAADKVLEGDAPGWVAEGDLAAVDVARGTP